MSEFKFRLQSPKSKKYHIFNQKENIVGELFPMTSCGLEKWYIKFYGEKSKKFSSLSNAIRSIIQF